MNFIEGCGADVTWRLLTVTYYNTAIVTETICVLLLAGKLRVNV